ncbi:hypothetical protein JW905_11455, partial [bacterium]|nr:hypothetical protein [candidate division CSSED10-310 bacterium]
YVKPEEDIELKVSTLYSQISEPALTGVSLTGLAPIEPYAVLPGGLPDLFYGNQLIVTGRYRDHNDVVLTLAGTRGKARQSFRVTGSFPKVDKANDFIPRLWATRRVGQLMDEIRLNGEDQELVDEIISLSKQYGIINQYTSYLVTEDIHRRTADLYQEEFADMQALGYASGIRKGGGNQGSLDRVFTEKLPARITAPQAMTRDQKGAGAVNQSVAARKMKSDTIGFTVEDSAADEEQIIRHVAGRTFYNADGTWIDSGYKESMKLDTIIFNSDEYFKFLDDRPELGKFLSLGSNVILVVGERAVKIVEKES